MRPWPPVTPSERRFSPDEIVPVGPRDDLTVLQVTDLLARASISDLVVRYNSYGDSGLFDRMLGIFAADAVLEIGDERYQGLPALRQAFGRVPAQTSKAGGRPQYLRHCTATHQIDRLDETTATGRCYFFVLTTVGLDHWGRYLDEYGVIDDEWRFTRRRVLTDDLDPHSIFATRPDQSP